jgi:RNA polymerase sigma-70 factor (ECF subfamily)
MIPPIPIVDRDRAAHWNLPEPGEWLERYGDTLYRYAQARLRRSHEVEDVVQETLLAALKARWEFEGRSQPLSWLIGILKRKILDRLRAEARNASDAHPDELDAWFNAAGHWRRPPRNWDDPAALAQTSEFWTVVRSCAGKLPPLMAEAFTLRALDDYRPAEVCQELAISPNHLWVLLHRARLRLVRCLEIHWFDNEQ